jgi:nucleoside-diphosphate-sugar epimerase
MAKKALITGIHGFIGTHLSEVLKERDIEPIGLDRHDLYLDIPQLTEIVFHHKPNYIFHLAAYGNHRQQQDSTKTIMANYLATYNLLEATKFLDYEAFINFGSSSMYGIKELSMKETDNLEPDTFYAATKAGAVHLARAFAKQYDAPICSVVPFSVYGDREASFRLIPAICEHLVTSESMSVTLSPTHDWIYVKDFIEGVLTVVENIDTLKGEMINIGTGKMTNNAGIIGTLELLSGKKLNTTHNKVVNKFDSPYWKADIAKLSTFGWKPKTNLGEGLKKCWDYYSKNHD